MPRWQTTRLSSPSPTTASAFPKATASGYSSAITAAATSRASSAPVSASIWSRWWSTCTAAPLRWKAQKARAPVSLSACRADPPLQRKHRRSLKRRRSPVRSMLYNPSRRASVNEAKPDAESSCACRSGRRHVGIGCPRRRSEPGKRPRRSRRLADPRATAAALPQPLHVREFHQPALLLEPLRHRLSILFLLGSILRLLPSRPRLLRLERRVALPPVT